METREKRSVAFVIALASCVLLEIALAQTGMYGTVHAFYPEDAFDLTFMPEYRTLYLELTITHVVVVSLILISLILSARPEILEITIIIALVWIFFSPNMLFYGFV